MKTPLLSLSFAVTAAFFAATASAGDCSREEIDHFLDRGFTPEQVVQLCGNTDAVVAPVVQAPTVTTTAPSPTPLAPPAQSTDTKSNAQISQDEWFTLKNALEVDTVKLENDSLIYERDRCHEFGTEGFTGFKEEACVVSRTQIDLNGLQVTSAKDGIFIIIEGELIVKSDITREILNLDSLKEGAQKRFLEEYSLQPDSLDIPLKSGFKHTKIAKIINKLAK